MLVYTPSTYREDMSKNDPFIDITPVVWTPARSFDQLPLLPPTVELETRAVLKRCVSARAALAELKQAAQLIPNQGVLINTLPLLEARASSEIENVVTTADEMFRSLSAPAGSDPATREALRYREALMAGYRELGKRPLGTRTAERVASSIRGVQMQVRHGTGTQLVNDATGEVIYTPPQGEDRLRKLLGNWEAFLHDDSRLDPLVRMSVGHYQFEAIHPFTDVNGRTGRVLNSLFLIQAELLGLPIFYLSRYLIGSKSDYYQKLLAVTAEAAWEPWNLFMLDGVEETATWTLAKIGAIRALIEQTSDYVQREAPSMYSRELIDVIFEQPYARIADVVNRGVAQRQTASVYLQRLVDLGVLQPTKAGRTKLFVNAKLMRLLTRDANEIVPF